MSVGEASRREDGELSDFLKRIQAGDEGPPASSCSASRPRFAWWCAGSCRGCCGRGSTRSTSCKASGEVSSAGCGPSPTEFEDSRHLVAFLARAAKNKVIDEYRRAASRKHDMHREEPLWVDGHRPKDVPDPIDSPSEIAQAHEVFGRLRDLVPEEKRSILEMKAEGLSSKDIGERLGISERTVQRVLEDLAQTHGDGVGEPVMNLSASRRTWEEASSPAAVRLARKYEQAWRDSELLGVEPDLREFLNDAGTAVDGPGARLAILRADMSLRWEAGDKVGAQWYLDRYPDLGEDTIVALIYEEFCLREEDQEHPDPAEFLARLSPGRRAAWRACSRSTSWSGRERHRPRFRSRRRPNGTVTADRAFPEAGQTIADFRAGRRAGPRGVRAGVPGQGAPAGRPAGGAQGVAARLARAADAGPAAAHAHRAGPLAPDRRGERAASAVHALFRADHAGARPGRPQGSKRRSRGRPGRGTRSARRGRRPAGGQLGRPAGARAGSYSRAIAWWCARLAEALAHAHDRGVLHRDIKPSNVLVTSDGMPMLLDFNLAREPLPEDGTAADTATLGGTIDYMAPEHLKALGEPSRTRSTAGPTSTAWASMLYEAVTGQRPFTSPRAGLVGRRGPDASDRRSPAAPRPPARSTSRNPPALEAVIRRCLEPAPARPLSNGRRAGGRPSGRRRRPAASTAARALAQPRGRLAPPPPPQARHGRRRSCWPRPPSPARSSASGTRTPRIYEIVPD